MWSNFLHLLLIVVFAVILTWTIYNVSLFFAGFFAFIRKNRRNRSSADISSFNEPFSEFPFVSVVIPVKDGEKVLPRLIESLLNVDYPKDKMEIILIEDGSKDKSYELCLMYARRYYNQVKVFHRETSKGKPDALNYGLKHASGDIIAFFDVDSVVARDSFKRAIKFLKDPKVIAVQQRTVSLNTDQNNLTRLAYIEETVSFIILEGRRRLNLFIPLTGSCMFIKKEALEKVGGWNADSLTEDAELSIRFLDKGYTIIYDSDVGAYQETPSSLRNFFKQRSRWYRGLLETLCESLKKYSKFEKRFMDAMVYLSSPLMALLSQVFYCSLLAVVLLGYNSYVIWMILQLSLISLFLTISLLIAFLVKFARWKLTKSLFISCLTFCYWFFLAFIALISLGSIIFGVERKWYATPKGEHYAYLPP